MRSSRSASERPDNASGAAAARRRTPAGRCPAPAVCRCALRALLASAITLIGFGPAAADELQDAIRADYASHLQDLFVHFHRNPELAFTEQATARRMAEELRSAGFDVTEGVGRTGLVAILENGDGPRIMMRADMDALPVEEESGLPYASTATQTDPATGDVVSVMHACGHDVHITSLVGTARQMAGRLDEWRGTLMLIVQPAEEVGLGALAMKEDDLWGRFGRPDAVLGFHVAAENEAGKINVQEGSPYAGVDWVDIVVRGIGAHGASPHMGKDPIVLASQIVLALQTLVSRELPPREPGVVTVGSFHAGTKSNIIPDEARLSLTVRNVSPESRKLLLDGIERIALNLGRAAGLPEDLLPEVIYLEGAVPPMLNDAALVRRLREVWREGLGEAAVVDEPPTGMGGEDFPYFAEDPAIPSAFWRVGGTPAADFVRAEAGGPPVPSHHSPLFRIAPEPSIRAGVESTVRALLELMPRR